MTDHSNALVLMLQQNFMKKLILYSGLALLIYSSCKKADDDYIGPPPIDTTDTSIVVPPPVDTTDTTTVPPLPSDTIVSLNYSDTVDLSMFPAVSLPFSIDTSFYQAVATNYQALLTQYGITEVDVVSVMLKTLNLKIIPSSTAVPNFDFVDSVSIYVYNDNLPEKLIANKVPFPTGQTSVNFNIVANQNLRAYFLQDSLKLRIHGSLNGTPIGSYIITKPTFEVTANLP